MIEPVTGQLLPSTADADRARVIAALHRLMTTGEPRHTNHDDGQWLQAEVDAAFARGDAEIERLALRAAVPLLARVTAPVSSIRELPALSIEMWPVLKVPRPATYTAAIDASVDGGELVTIDTLTNGRGASIGRFLPAAASLPGLHHLRLRATLTFASGSGLAVETRDLPELVYALYDPASTKVADAALLVESAAAASAQRLDGALPPIRFDQWLRTLVLQYGGEFKPSSEWRTAYCDERLLEPGIHARTRNICVVAEFFFLDRYSGVEQIWIRTGRVELAETEVRWLAEAPAFEGLMLRGVESGTLASLTDILRNPPDDWPLGDVSVAPEDITVAVRANSVHVEAALRNTGSADLRNVLVMVSMTTDGQKDTRRQLLVNVPQGGSTTVATDLPLLDRYGVVMVHAMQFSEHVIQGMSPFDPTPDDVVAFRIVNPRQAPRGYAEWLKSQCGPICRGF